MISWFTLSWNATTSWCLPSSLIACRFLFALAATSNNVHRFWNRLEDEQRINSGLSISAFENEIIGCLENLVQGGQLSCYDCGRCFGEAELSRIFRRLFSILRVVNARACASVKRFSLLQRTNLEMLIGCLSTNVQNGVRETIGDVWFQIVLWCKTLAWK